MALALLTLILKLYVVLSSIALLVYTARHLMFAMNRVSGEQRMYYHDLIDSELPSVTVMVPMHNEERVARDILDSLIGTVYPADKLEIIPILRVPKEGDLLVDEHPGNAGKIEIIPIDDHSTDNTMHILDEYAQKYSRIKPLYRRSGKAGKAYGLNDALKEATGDVIVVFDADYIPPKGIIRDLTMCFKDPEVGAVMGRVVPVNTSRNLLTRLLDLERSSGYQVDQQARHNMRLIPQYGGTVGAFRKKVADYFGGFNPGSLTEDTELTFKLYSRGWKVVYANRAECYEEVPEDWEVRARQIRRWSRGHNTVMFHYLGQVLHSPYLSRGEKFDGALLLGIYAVPAVLLLSMIASLALFFLGEMTLFQGMFVFMLVIAYNSFGNFAPFYQIATAGLLDGATYRVRFLPFLLFSFMFNIWYVFQGLWYAVLDVVTKREKHWEKTDRFRQKGVST